MAQEEAAFLLEGFPGTASMEWIRANTDISGGTRLTKSRNVPAELQQAFAELTGGGRLLYVGKTNRGDKFNNVLHDKPLVFDGSSARLYFDRYGALKGPTIQDDWSSIHGVVEDAVFVPDSVDVYLILKNEFSDERYPLRLDLGGEVGTWTGIGVLNLARDVQPARRWNNMMKDLLLDADRPLIDFVRPGDMVAVILHPSQDWRTATKDENGVYGVRGLIVERGHGADALEESIFD